MNKIWLVFTLIAWLILSSHGIRIRQGTGYKEYNQAVYNAVNMARSTPSLYANLIEKQTQNFMPDLVGLPSNTLCLDRDYVSKSTTCSNKLDTMGGKWWWDDAVQNLRSTTAIRTLGWSEGLSQACYDHIQSQGPSGFTGEMTPDGRMLNKNCVLNSIWSFKTELGLRFQWWI